MNRDLGFISLSLLTWGLGEAAFLAFQPLYLQNLGADPIQIGTIYGAYGLAASLVHIPAGYLSDRLGRRPAMWSAWFIGVIATWMMALANSLPWFVAGMLLYGSTMFVIAPMNSYVTTARGKFTVARALTLISATYNVGTILGPLLGGYIGERLGIRAIFFIAAGIFLCSTIFILFIRPQPLDNDSKQESGKPIFANRRFLAFLPVIFLIIFAGYLPQPLSPNFLQNHRGLTLTNIGQLYSINGLGIVVLNLLLGQMRSGVGLVLGQLCVGAFALLLWKGSGFLSFSLAYFLLGGFRTTRLLALAAARPLVKQSEMGLSYGLIETAGAMAILTASPLAGYLYDRNPLLIYSVSAGLILLSSLTSLAFLYNRPQIQRPEMISVEEG